MADLSTMSPRAFEGARYETVRLGALFKHPLNTRLISSEDDVSFINLCADIAVNGLIAPLVVISAGALDLLDTKYLVVDGSRRCHAVRLLRGEEHLVRIQVVDLSEAQIVDVIASTDAGSEKLTEYERALLLKEQVRVVGSADALAARYGISKSAISKHLALADLPPDVLACVTDRAKISIRGGSAYRVANKRDPDAVAAALVPFREQPAPAKVVFAAIQQVVSATGRSTSEKKAPPLAYASFAAEVLNTLGGNKRIAPKHHEAILALLDAIASNVAYEPASHVRTDEVAETGD